MSKTWQIVSEITNELNKQLNSGTEGFVAEDRGVTWAVSRPYTDTEKESDDGGPNISKFRRLFKMGESYTVKALTLSIQNFKEDGYATIFVSTTLNNKSKSITINLRWYDHFRPTVFKVKRLISRVRFELLEHNSLGLDKHLAEIIPNRIDTILLGEGKDEETTD